MLVTPRWPISRADCAVSACSPLSLSVKVLPPDCQWGGGGLIWTGVCPPHLPYQLLASKIKQTFLSTNLASLLSFWAVSCQTPFSDTVKWGVDTWDKEGRCHHVLGGQNQASKSIRFRDLVDCLWKAWKGMLRICLQDSNEYLHKEEWPNQISALERLSWQ